MTVPPVFHLMGFAFFVSLAICGFMMAARITDTPGARSSHSRPTPTAGGVGIVSGMAAALMALRYFYPDMDNPPLFFGLSGLGLLVAALGFADDRFIVPTLLKMLLLGVIAFATPAIAGIPLSAPLGLALIDLPPGLAYGGAALWVFVVMNAVNFMDGANGLMGCFMMIAAAGLSAFGVFTATPDVTLMGGALAASIAGLLPYNCRTEARIFCGDTGSLFIGFVFAAGALRLVSGGNGEYMLYAAPLLILPFLTDVLLTLIKRTRRGENLLQAHRSHLYHLMLKSGAGHLEVTRRYMLAAALFAVIALIGGYTGLIGSAAFFLIFVFLTSYIYVRLTRKFES